MTPLTFGRRGFLTGVGAVALIPMRGPFAMAQPLDLEAFLELSRHVTGHTALDARIGAPLLAAFSDSGAIAGLTGLSADEDSAARRAVLRAWYLGKVSPDGLPAAEDAEDLERGPGEEEDDDDTPDQVLAYEGTLMGAVVADLIPLPSYCGGLPHFWTEPPDDPDISDGDRP